MSKNLKKNKCVANPQANIFVPSKWLLVNARYSPYRLPNSIKKVGIIGQDLNGVIIKQANNTQIYSRIQKSNQ
jgi:hypothetical protein